MISARNRGFRSFCWLMTFVTAATPPLTAYAQSPGTEQTELAYCLRGSCLVVSARPNQLLTSPLLEMFPIEVLQAAMLKETGVDPLEATRLTVSVLPTPQPPSYSITAQFASPIVGRLNAQLIQHTQLGELAGRPLMQSAVPQLPSLFFPEDMTIVAAPEATLQKLVRGTATTTSDEMQKRLQAAAADDIYMCIDIAPLRPLIQIGLMQAEIPLELEPFLMAPNLIRYVELRLNFTGGGPTELIVEANDATAANELMGLVEQAIDIARQEILVAADRLQRDPDPVQQATGRYQERLVSKYSQTLKPVVDGKQLVLCRMQPGEGDTPALTMTAVSGVLVSLLLPAVQAAHEAARRNMSMNNMKQIMLSLHNYHDSFGQLPAHASYDDNGKPLLSWRVHILPFLEEQQLYEQFHLDEPWDSDHNRQLIAKMPELYLEPSSGLGPTEGRTHYLGAQGNQNIFDGTKDGISFRQITDGLSNTIAILQVNNVRAAIWTQPDDWELDKDDPLKGVKNSPHPAGFLAGLCR